METRYFFSIDGDYLGGFQGEGALALVPSDAIEVPEAPAHGFDKLIDGQIVAYVEQVPLADKLSAVFETLPLDFQADFSPLRAAVKAELESDRIAVAKRIIERATVPSDLEPLRQTMLKAFT